MTENTAPLAWMIVVALVSFFAGMLFILGTLEDRTACSFACAPDALGYRYEPGKCECIP